MTDPAALERKRQAAVERLAKLDGAVVAFSGGVDSTLLLALAREALGDRVLAVSARSPSWPKREREAAAALASALGAPRAVIEGTEMGVDDYRRNGPDRCYHCKKSLFASLREIACREELEAVLEGSNADDRADYRPGRRAVEEAGVLSPLLDAGITKEEVRALAKSLGLPNWDKPAAACLASRIPYGETITAERLARVEAAEDAIADLGFSGHRVRDHGNVARVEVRPEEMERFLAPATRATAAKALKDAGFRYVAVDLEGYRTGSLNEDLEGPPA